MPSFSLLLVPLFCFLIFASIIHFDLGAKLVYDLTLECFRKPFACVVKDYLLKITPVHVIPSNASKLINDCDILSFLLDHLLLLDMDYGY